MKFIDFFFVFSSLFLLAEALPTDPITEKTPVKSSEATPTTAGVPCPSPVAPLNGYIKGDKYTPGSLIHFLCNNGYFRRGHPIAVCQADGRWTHSNVTCIARSCGDPGTPANGKRTGMIFQYPHRVLFSCNKGFALEGPDTRTCQANKTWSDSQPVCKPISCGEPPYLVHSKIFLYGEGGFVYGNQVEYVCKPGYYREGDQKIYCGDDGQWQGSLPVCKEVRCPQPKPLLNGTMQMGNNTEGSIVRYSCNPGYRLFGSHWRKCLKTRKWTGPEPICFECAGVGTPVFVRKTSYFKHGSIKSKSGNHVAVYYEAEDNEEDILILGKGSQHYAIVEDRIPSKNEIFVGTRVLAVNAQARKYMLGAVRMISGGLYSVQFDGRFENQKVPLDEIRTLEPPRFCATCSDPGRPAFSSREDYLTEFIPGMEVIYTCEYTYKMTGSQTRLCQKDGTWTGTAPKCTVFSCDELDAFPPRNGNRKGNNFTIGSTLEFSCDDGYVLVGQSQLTCTKNGNWSHLPPTCKTVCEDFMCQTVGEKCQYVKYIGPRCVCRANEDCRALYEPVCGSDGNSYNSHCIMSATACRAGKRIKMVDRGHCLPGALCQINPHSVCRGYFPRYFYNSTSQQCQYFIAGGCHPSGWNGFNTEQECNQTCFGDICKQPISPGPCAQRVSRWAFNATTGRCKKFNYGGCFGNENNFLSKELCQRRCKPRKEKAPVNSSEATPTTAGVPCPSPVAPLNGYIKGDKYTPGSLIHFLCNNGYFRRGHPIAVCQADGRWTHSNVTCIARSCGDPGTPANGKRTGMIFQYPHRVLFSCNKGFALEGPDTRTCQANKTWSDSQPVCKPISCGEPPYLVHSKIFLYGEGGFVYGNQVEYVCKPGYYREGDQKIYCGDDGQWQGSLPICKEVRCPQPKPLLNGTMQMDNNTEGSIVRYSCNPGYRLFGSHWRKCLKTRKWTGPEPICFECAGVGTPVFVRKTSHFKHGTIKSKSGNHVAVYYEAEDDEEDILILGKGTQHYAIVEDRIPSKNEIFVGTRVLAVNAQARKYMLGAVRIISGGQYVVQFDGRFENHEVPLDEIRTLEPPRFCATCSDPGRPAFSSREDYLTEFIPGMEVIYTCEYTYKMTGSQTRLCQKDGTWTGTAPKCTVFSCDELDAFPPRNGNRKGNNFTIGSTLEFSCDDGYVLVGQSQLTCTKNGNWSHLPPTCKNVCEGFKCQTVGEKCQYVKDVGSRCVCRANEDCRALYEPVCGSDGNSYNSHCIMSATACRAGKRIKMVDRGHCLPGALCQINPHSVCRGYFPRYFYNSTSQQCQYFIAGGCHPSGWNGFDTEQECKQTCLGDICKQPISPGPCAQRVSRWAFNATTGRCKKFNYGGCFGNENNFLSKELCQRRCRPRKVAARGKCPNCVRPRLHQACQNSNLAILARVMSVLPKDEEKHLQRYHLNIDRVIQDTSSTITEGKTIIISVPYNPTTKCSCLRIPKRKKFVLIGQITSDKTADPKSGVIVSPQFYTSGWTVNTRKQLEKKCGRQLIVPRDIL